MGFWDESVQSGGLDGGVVVVRGPFDALIHFPREYPLLPKAAVREAFEVLYEQGNMPESFEVAGVTYRREATDGR